MTTYTWPDTRTFVPQQSELRVIDNSQRTLESPMSGYVQTLSMPGARWGMGMDFAPQNIADRSDLEAFLLRLSGREHRVQLWDLKRPRPLGNISTSGVTLGASAAQFATALTLAGAQAQGQLIRTPERLSAAAWSGSTGIAVLSSLSVISDLGLPADGIVESSGTNGGNGHGVRQSVVLQPGIYTLSWHASPLERVRCSMWAFGAVSDVTPAFYDLGALTVAGTGSPGIAAAYAGGWSRCHRTIVVTSAGTVTFHIGPQDSSTTQDYSGDGSSRILVWGVQLESGGLTAFKGRASLTAGDWLGLTGGQLVRAVVDASADDLDQIAVEVRHMLRSAVASGTAVTLDRPTALYVRTEAGIALPRQPGTVEPGLSVDFVEVFA